MDAFVTDVHEATDWRLVQLKTITWGERHAVAYQVVAAPVTILQACAERSFENLTIAQMQQVLGDVGKTARDKTWQGHAVAILDQCLGPTFCHV